MCVGSLPLKLHYVLINVFLSLMIVISNISSPNFPMSAIEERWRTNDRLLRHNFSMYTCVNQKHRGYNLRINLQTYLLFLIMGFHYGVLIQNGPLGSRN